MYKLGKRSVNALNGISLNVNRGDFISIMGPSGSGKTTLLNLIGALDVPTKGEIYINGYNISSLKDVELTRLRRFEIGFIFQFYNLIPVLTCFENIELPLISAGVKKSERKKRVEYLIHKVELEKYMDHKPNELSGGQQQRVAIARALVNRPSLILADELTGDLDTRTGEKIIDYLKSINKSENQTIIIATHDISVANKTNRIYHILDGRFIN
ncbi:MAG: ABC transporter ATP-binding protein [Candidatus Thorarchaeota archaeon]